MKIATGEVEEGHQGDSDTKDQSAVLLGRKGGQARAAALPKTKRIKIASEAANVRWSKHKK